MEPITPRSTKTWSLLGHRGCFALAMLELAESNPGMRVLTADLGMLSGLDRFKNSHPEKFINVGIAEQNMVGIAAGLAKEGHLVYATTYSNFLAMRSYEQVRINLGYMGFPVHLVGTGSGIAMGMSGNSHYGLEDLALMRAVPGLTVLSPADGTEIIKTLLAVRDYGMPTYIRLSGGMNLPVVYTEDYEFRIGKAKVLRDGADVTVFATGTMVHEALVAAAALDAQGVSVAVVNVSTIKPLDEELVFDYIRGRKLVVTVEEHGVVGGLGGAIAELKATCAGLPRQLFIGLPDRFGKIGDYAFLLEKYGLTGASIAGKISDELLRA